MVSNFGMKKTAYQCTALFYFHQEDQVHQIEELWVILGILLDILEDGYPVGACLNFSLDYQGHS